MVLYSAHHPHLALAGSLQCTHFKPMVHLLPILNPYGVHMCMLLTETLDNWDIRWAMIAEITSLIQVSFLSNLIQTFSDVRQVVSHNFMRSTQLQVLEPGATVALPWLQDLMAWWEMFDSSLTVDWFGCQINIDVLQKLLIFCLIIHCKSFQVYSTYKRKFTCCLENALVLEGYFNALLWKCKTSKDKLAKLKQVNSRY